MGENSKIEWTDHTFNPWWGCTKISPGCDLCYAKVHSTRYGFNVWGHGQERRVFGDQHWDQPRKWDRRAQRDSVRRRVFCASMADVFDAEAPATELPKLWALIRETPALDWQLLTKRPNRIHRVLPPDLVGAPNVWLGTSVENSEYVWRVPELVKVPAVVHFLSVEPLLGPIANLPLDDIEWVIVGGESGSGYRPMKAEWVQEIRDRCVSAGVAFFFKQWGGRTPKAGGRLLDGQEWNEMPVSRGYNW